jgi:hypothetical protein
LLHFAFGSDTMGTVVECEDGDSAHDCWLNVWWLDRLKVDAAVVDSAVTMMTATTTSCLSAFPFLLTVVVVVGQDFGGCA